MSDTVLSFASLGDTTQLTAEAKDADGQSISGGSFTWVSSDTTVASVSATGLVTAVANGTATVTVTSGSASATASATIEQVAASITLSPDSLVFVAVGDTATVTAIVLDAGGSEIPSPTLTWSSSDTTAVTVNSSGLVTAVASGLATVTAQTGDLQATVSARMTGSSYLTVTVTGDGDPLPDVDVWLTDPATTNTKKITDTTGKVLFGNLQAGEHMVTLQQLPIGLTITSPQTIQITEDEGHDLVFTGAFAPAQVTGTAKSWGKPVEGALVRIEGKDTVEVTVNSAGVFQVDSIRRGGSGIYTFTISNYTGVNFKEAILTETLESGANTPEFIGRPDPLTWTSVTAGAEHSCGLTSTGEAYCWGKGSSGQLGDGTRTNPWTPMLVSGRHTWASVDAGSHHTCGVTTAGEAYCWGDNWTVGKLGNGKTTNSLVPALVIGELTWASVDAGYLHTCGVTTGGAAYCWGANQNGQLGNGTTTAYSFANSEPVLVSGGFSWASVETGRHSCGVTTAGEAYCWGEGGALGDGTTTDSSVPVLVSGGFSWASVGTGRHSCGVTTEGKGYCWGSNSGGKLGDGTTTYRSVPTLVTGGNNWASVDAGSHHTCGVTTFGEAYCWGWNGYGRLGDGTNTNSSVPVLVSGGFSWTSVSANNEMHSCGVTTFGEAYCWGDNREGKLGNGTRQDSWVPVKVGGNW